MNTKYSARPLGVCQCLVEVELDLRRRACAPEGRTGDMPMHRRFGSIRREGISGGIEYSSWYITHPILTRINIIYTAKYRKIKKS
jgi:hypothetical protein